MRKKVERPQGRVGAKILLLVGGAAAMAGAVALGGLGPVPPADGQNSSPRAMSTLPDLTRDAAPAASLPSRPSSAESTSPVPVSLALPHGRTTARGEGDGIEQVGVANKREEVDEPHARRRPSQPRRLANTATDRRPSRPGPRSKRGPSGPRPDSLTPSERGGTPSLFAMRCDELFPAHKREFRLRNIACHHLLGY